MSKGLEALKDIKMRLYVESETQTKLINKDLSIIESELKEYESYRTFLDNVEKGLVTYTPRDTWAKERKQLKALELIKKYNIRPSDFHYHTTYQVYLCNMSFADDDEIMSEEEYDLLKEVLL